MVPPSCLKITTSGPTRLHRPQQKHTGARRRVPFDASTAIITVLMASAAATVLVRDGTDRFLAILGSDLGLFVEILPKVLAGCLIGAFIALLLPRELVARWVGAESGFVGILVSTCVGALLLRLVLPAVGGGGDGLLVPSRVSAARPDRGFARPQRAPLRLVVWALGRRPAPRWSEGRMRRRVAPLQEGRPHAAGDRLFD